MDDNNLAVCKAATECFGCLCKGLGTSFAFHARSAFSVLIERMKEKKLTDCILALLDSIDAKCLSFTEVLDDVLAGCKHKVPGVKVATITWVERRLSTKSKKDVTKLAKPLAIVLAELTDDASKEAREMAFKALGRLLSVHDINAQIAKLDKIKLEKIKQYCASIGGSSNEPEVSQEAKTVEKPKPTATAAPPKPKAATSVPPAAKPEPAKKPAAQSTNKTTTTTTTTKKTAAKKATKEAPEDEPRCAYSSEDALQKADEIIPANIMTLLSGKNWKERLEGLEKLQGVAIGLVESLESNAEVLARLLQSKPGWKETNVQVLCKAFEIIGQISAKSPSTSKVVAMIVCSGLIGKLATAKAGDSAKSCLTQMATKTGPQYLFAQIYKYIPDQKTPKSVAEALNWMNTAIASFGLKRIKLDKLITFMKTALDNTNPAVKKEATAVLCSMRKYVGPTLIDSFKDLKGALLTVIEKEFEKVANEAAPAPTLTVEGEPETDEAENCADMMPRTDISGEITTKLLKDMNSGTWQTRLEAVNSVIKSITNAGKRIGPNIGELFPELKKRLDDTSQKLVTTSLSLLALVATAMGPAVDKYTKYVMYLVMMKLFDNKKPIRTCALETMEAWVAETTLAPLLKYIPKCMSNDKGHPDGKKESLAFMVKYASTIKGKQPDNVSPIIKPVIDSLQDPKPETRKLAETLVPFIIEHCGDDAVKKACRDLKPAFHESVNAVVCKYFTGVPSVEVRAADPMQIDDMTDNTQVATLENSHSSNNAFAISSAKDVLKKLPTTSSFVKQPEKAQVPQPMATSTTMMPMAQPQLAQTTNEEYDGPLLENNQKQQRAMRNGQIKWYFDKEPSFTQIEMLKEHMEFCVTRDLHKLLFAPQFKPQVQGLEMLISTISHCQRALVDNVDVLLQLCTAKVSEQNPSIVITTAQLLQKLAQKLHDMGYSLNDYEVSIFLPILTEKLGHAVAPIRDILRQVIKAMRKICMPTAIFATLCDYGIASKNAKTREMSLAEMGDMLVEYGSSIVAAPQQLVAMVVPLLNDVEGVKELAQKFLAALQQICKDVVVPFTQNKNEDAMGMLKNHAAIQLVDMDAMNPTMTLKKLIANIAVSFDTRVVEITVENIKRLDILLREAKPLVVQPVLREMIACFVVNIRAALENGAQYPAFIRIAKYLLSTLMTLYNQKKVVELLDAASLKDFMDQFLRRLLDERLPTLEEGQVLLKALNNAMLRVLETSDRTRAYTALIGLLSDFHSTDDKKRYTELVVKCLLKITKTLPQTIDMIDLDQLLSDLHNFLAKNPPSNFEKGKNDLPLRTVKTILNEIVRIKGESIRMHFGQLPTHQNLTLVSYIDLAISSKQPASDVAGLVRPNTAPGILSQVQLQQVLVQPPVVQLAPTTLSPAEQAALDMKMHLQSIFNKIGNSETSRQGLYMLYKFTKENPDADIMPFLKKCSEPFQVYIQRQLKKFADHEQKGNSPTSSNLSQSLVLPSPAPALPQTITTTTPTMSFMPQQPLPMFAPTTSVPAPIFSAPTPLLPSTVATINASPQQQPTSVLRQLNHSFAALEEHKQQLEALRKRFANTTVSTSKVEEKENQPATTSSSNTTSTLRDRLNRLRPPASDKQ